MLIAQEKRKTNIAEYILYMWQLEDLLRACSFDPQIVEDRIVNQFKVDEITRNEIACWYENLAAMMQKEHVELKGHLQVITNLVNDLNEFHLKMLEVQNDKEYVRLYQTNQTAIDEIMKKMLVNAENEIDACFSALYGFMILKLKSSEISDQTNQTIGNIAHQLGHLSARYLQFENDEFEF